ncbi:MAG: transketolase family protein [Christensenellales bacterium]|jgi:transketolase
MDEKKMIPTRDALGDGLLELAEKFPQMRVVDVDVSKSVKTDLFAKKYPERHVNVGIAEQNAATFAAGMATTGLMPVMATFAVFGSMRMLEQMRTSVCYPDLNVKLLCTHAGLTSANDGATHQAIEDIGIYRSVPGIRVIMPADYVSAKKLMEKAFELHGPVYMRFTRDPVPVLYGQDESFEIGKGKVLREGADIAVIALGDMVCQALAAARALEKGGYGVRVVDMHTIKPLDEDLVLDCVERCGGRVVVAEDHNVHGGLGDAVASVMARQGRGRLRKIGIPDTYAESGPYLDLLEKYGLSAGHIESAARELLQK